MTVTVSKDVVLSSVTMFDKMSFNPSHIAPTPDCFVQLVQDLSHEVKTNPTNLSTYGKEQQHPKDPKLAT